MAVFELHPIKSGHDGMKKCDTYIKNKRKTLREKVQYEDLEHNYTNTEDHMITDKDCYITGLNCSPDNSYSEFMLAQKQFGTRGKGIEAHHGWQSFKKDCGLTSQEVHKIGCELARKFFGERFQVIVTTHTDQEHLHNHFLVNATSYIDGKKYAGNKTNLNLIRKLNDEICMECGLETILKPRYFGTDKGKYHIEKNGDVKVIVWRDVIKADIDSAIKQSISLDDFFENMKFEGYLFKAGKHFAVSPPEFYKNGHRAYIRLESINNADYTLGGITNRIKQNSIINYGVLPQKNKRRVYVKCKRKLPWYKATYYKYMYEMGLMEKKPRPTAKKLQRIQKAQLTADSLSKQIKFIHENKLVDEKQLTEKKQSIKIEMAEKEKIRNRIRKELYKENNGEKTEVRENLNDINLEIKRMRDEIKICEKIKVITENTFIEPKTKLDKNRATECREVRNEEEEKCQQKQKQQKLY